MSKISKVIYGGEVLIDLTADTVAADKLLTGYTAHGADGEPITGSCAFDVDSSSANATADTILSGKTAGVKGAIITGTMPNKGGVTGYISSKEDQYTIPLGYHDGSGKVGIHADEKVKLIPENIREGITLLGIEGTMSGTEDANPQAKTVVPTTLEQTILPDTSEGYNYLSQVTVRAIPYSEVVNSAGGLTATIA